MRITVDPNTDSSGFSYAAEGEYDLRVVECEQKLGKDSGLPYLNWRYEYVDVNLQTHDGKGKLGNIFDMTTLKSGDNAQFALKRVCDALGLEWGDFDTEDTKGLEFKAKVKIGLDQSGDKRNEIAKYIAKGA